MSIANILRLLLRFVVLWISPPDDYIAHGHEDALPPRARMERMAPAWDRGPGWLRGVWPLQPGSAAAVAGGAAAGVALGDRWVEVDNALQRMCSSIIIGEGTLPVQCAEVLLRRGHPIHAIISSDTVVHRWTEAHGIPFFEPTADLAAVLSMHSFDFLFSIVNSHLLPNELLRLPRKGAINYHDAPLPRYAGMYATSWALMHRETRHGITWHVMSEQIDAGDILKQRFVDIADGETALSLNAKCYDAAIAAFTELIDDLENGRAPAQSQELADRSYFPRHKRPPAGCVLSWDRSADEIDAFVRALDFGPYRNPLGLPKLAIHGDLVIVPAVQILASGSGSPPGTLTGLTDEGLTVATGSRDIRIRSVLTLEGEALSPADLRERFGLCEGYQFPALEPERADRITDLHASLSRHEAFWVARLAKLYPLTLSGEKEGAVSENGGNRESFSMPIPEGVALLLARRSDQWNQGDFLLAAFGAYLARTTGVSSFDIGFREAHSWPNLEGAGEFFVSHVPFRIEPAPEQSFAERFQATREQVAALRKQLLYARDTVARFPVLRALPVLHSAHPLPVRVDRVPSLGPVDNFPGDQLRLIIPEHGTECRWVYDTALGKDGVVRMAGQFAAYLQSIAADPEESVGCLPLITEQERHQLLFQWNATRGPYPREKCIHELFEEQVERTPQAVAAAFAEERLTYAELNRRANQLAAHLRKVGVGPEVLVGLCVERSIEMVVAVLGILKAGGAYVPLDPEYPADRLAFMLQDAQVEVLVTECRLAARLPRHEAKLVCLDTDAASLAAESEETLPSNATAENLAYVIYTSGSTGRPKGVMVPHRTVINLWVGLDRSVYADAPASPLRISVNAPLAFDASVKQLVMLLSGHTLHIVPREIRHDGEQLLAFVRRHRLDVLDCTPSHLKLLVAAGLLDKSGWTPGRVLCGGDVLDEPTWEAVVKAADVQFYNLYGPTECTVDATACRITDALSQTTIGRPLLNVQAYVLDLRGQILPVGVTGELHIGGEGVTRGYLQRPELTAERFIPNPFHGAGSEVEGQRSGVRGQGAGDEQTPTLDTRPSTLTPRLYKTGDLARYLPDGNIEFVGRVDHQVKIRGYRIELGEIESALRRHPGVQEAVVLGREDQPGDKRLVAYMVPHELPGPATGALRQFLQAELPDFMIPAAFVPLEALPLSPNGKIDRAALPAPDGSGGALDPAFVAPRTPVEAQLACIWAEVLGLKQVGVFDNFFEIGGHSLLATQVVSRVRISFEVQVPLHVLFEKSSLEQYAAAVAQALTECPDDAELDRMLAELEDLSDEDADLRLAQGL